MTPETITSAESGGTTLSVVSIPVDAVPSQELNVNLGNAACRIAIYQRSTGLYLDLAADNVAIVTGALCRDRVWIVRDIYLGFAGDLSFIDTQGKADPEYSSLGSRYLLVWGS